MNIFLATIFAHMVSDFIIQSDKTVEEKSKKLFKGFLRHFFEVFIPLLAVLLLQFKFFDIIIYSIIIALTHIIIDMSKILIKQNYIENLSAGLLVFDQLLHISIVIIIAILFDIKFIHNSYLEGILPVFNNEYLNYVQVNAYIILKKVELYSIIYIFFGIGAGVFIGNYLKPFKPENQEINPLKAGKYIGIIERFVIITLSMLSQFNAIAFIVAAKSLARHEDLNKRGFAEYYLLGTLLSIFTGITGGLLLKYLIPLIN